MMENTPKNDAVSGFPSDFCNGTFKMKIGGTVYEVSTHFDRQ